MEKPREAAYNASIIKMINQIAEQHNHLPPNEAVEFIRQHIHRFWAPSMMETLKEQSQSDSSQLHPIAKAFIKTERSI